MSKDISQLLFEFLNFVFHFDDNLLDVEIGGFGTSGVDLAAHLLHDKTEFLALGLRLSHRFEEVVAMLAQADFFFRDVQLLNIEDHLLLQAVRIVLVLHLHILEG